ncbi:hypothetical protein N8482_00845 [Chitinophagales bacterium]|nr:hypothetical protein [Chitinophagales bacterium]
MKSKNLQVLSLVLVLLFPVLLLLSCGKSGDSVELTGEIREQGITTYQYGSHTINGVALRSADIDLDEYVGQIVTVVGHEIEGYPVDGGPDYIEVEEVK